MKRKNLSISIGSAFVLVCSLILFMTQDLHAWGWKRAQTPDDVKNFLNGTGAYKHPVKVAKICAVQMNGYTDFFIFYEGKQSEQAKGNWAWKRSQEPNDVMNFSNKANV